jgi:hypothetical protein
MSKDQKPLMPEDTPKALSGRTLSAGLAIMGIGIASGIFVIVNINIQSYTILDFIGPLGLMALGGYFVYTAFESKKK